MDRHNIANLPLAKYLEKGVVISTSICECGANLNPDIVVDTSTCYISVINGDSDVVMALRPVSEASCIQRVGRVGRRKKGEFMVALPFRIAPTRFFPPGDRHLGRRSLPLGKRIGSS